MFVYQLSEICHMNAKKNTSRNLKILKRKLLCRIFLNSPLQVMEDTMCQFLVLRIFSLLKDKKGRYCIKLKLHTPEGVISSGNRDMLCSPLNTLHPHAFTVSVEFAH